MARAASRAARSRGQLDTNSYALHPHTSRENTPVAEHSPTKVTRPSGDCPITSGTKALASSLKPLASSSPSSWSACAGLSHRWSNRIRRLRRCPLTEMVARSRCFGRAGIKRFLPPCINVGCGYLSAVRYDQRTSMVRGFSSASWARERSGATSQSPPIFINV